MSVAEVQQTTSSRPVLPQGRSLRRAGVLGLGWSSLAQLVCLAIRLASNLILTRLLAPDIYGVLGPALTVLTTLEWVSDCGIVPALIRHPEGGTLKYLQTGWSIGVLRGALITLVAICSAWPLAEIYTEPQLFGVLAAVALRPVLISLRSPGMPLLRRHLNYRALFCDELCQTIVGTALSLGLAWFFPSVWAIVGGALAGALAAVVLSYWLCPVCPTFTWDRPAATAIGTLGRQVYLNTLIMALSLNLDRLAGPRLLAVEEMGFYFVAWNLASVLEGLLTRGCEVYFGVLSRLSGESRLLWHHRIRTRLLLWGTPLGVLAIVLAPVLIRVLYDSRYQACGFLFALMMGRLLFRAHGQVHFQHLLAHAQVRPATLAYLISLVVQVGLLVVCVQYWGVTGLALAALVTAGIHTAVQQMLAERTLSRPLAEFVYIVVWVLIGIIGASCLISCL